MPGCVTHCWHSPITAPSPGSGAMQTWPHRVLQHFSSPGHCPSPAQGSWHRDPAACSLRGQIPGFSGRQKMRSWGWLGTTRDALGGCSVAPTLGWTQAHVVTAPQAALLLAEAVGVTPAPLSAVVAREQPGAGRAEAILPCRAWGGVERVPLCSAAVPRGHGPAHVGRVHCLIHHCIPPCWGPPSCKVTPRPLAPGCTLHPGWQLCCWCGSMWQGQGWQYLHGRAELGWWGHWVRGESGMTTVECLHCPHHVLTPSLLLCTLLPCQPLSACVGYRGHPWSPGHGPTCDPHPTPSHPVSRAGAAGRHWRPQLLLQHFSALGQSLSPLHSSRHGPSSSGSTTGHSPALGFSGGAEQSGAVLSTAGHRGTSHCPHHPELRALTVAQARPAARCPRPKAVGIAPAAAVGERLAAPGGDVVEEAQLVAAAGPRHSGEMADVCSTALSAPPSRGCPRARGSGGTRRPYPAPAPRRPGRSPVGSTSGYPGSLCPPGTGRSRGKRAPPGPQRGRHRASLQHRVARLGARCTPRAPMAAPASLPLWPSLCHSPDPPPAVSPTPHVPSQTPSPAPSQPREMEAASGAGAALGNGERTRTGMGLVDKGCWWRCWGCASVAVPSAGGMQRRRHSWEQHLSQPGHAESLVQRGGSWWRQRVKSRGHRPGF